MDFADLMTKADVIRKKLGEDSNSPIDIFTLAQNIENLTLVYYPMGNNISGMCIMCGTRSSNTRSFCSGRCLQRTGALHMGEHVPAGSS